MEIINPEYNGDHVSENRKEEPIPGYRNYSNHRRWTLSNYHYLPETDSFRDLDLLRNWWEN